MLVHGVKFPITSLLQLEILLYSSQSLMHCQQTLRLYEFWLCKSQNQKPNLRARIVLTDFFIQCITWKNVSTQQIMGRQRDWLILNKDPWPGVGSSLSPEGTHPFFCSYPTSQPLCSILLFHPIINNTHGTPNFWALSHIKLYVFQCHPSNHVLQMPYECR
jgi:hypothetical protein